MPFTQSALPRATNDGQRRVSLPRETTPEGCRKTFLSSSMRLVRNILIWRKIALSIALKPTANVAGFLLYQIVEVHLQMDKTESRSSLDE